MYKLTIVTIGPAIQVYAFGVCNKMILTYSYMLLSNDYKVHVIFNSILNSHQSDSFFALNIYLYCLFIMH